MRLHEISKGTFQRKLQSEWFSELVERINKFNEDQKNTGWKVTLRDDQNPMEIELKRFKPGVKVTTLHTAEIEFIKTVLQPLGFEAGREFYELDRLPVSQHRQPYVIYGVLQPKLNEAKLSKDEFVQRLQDPRKAALEDKLKEWDDILRNRLGWRLDWSTWDLDPNVVTVTAYKPRTLPYPTTTVEDVRSNLWSFLLQDRWDEKNDIQITFEDEDETSVTWEFELTE